MDFTSITKVIQERIIGKPVAVTVSEDHIWNGTVASVRFTRTHMLYDVLADSTADIIKDIDSRDCKQVL